MFLFLFLIMAYMFFIDWKALFVTHNEGSKEIRKYDDSLYLNWLFYFLKN